MIQSQLCYLCFKGANAETIGHFAIIFEAVTIGEFDALLSIIYSR